MTDPSTLERILITWGDRLFYPGNRIVRDSPARLKSPGARAAQLRQRLVATAQRRVLQVMVKVTGGGRGMGPITAHLRYISKGGRLPIEDEQGRCSRARTPCTTSPSSGATVAPASRRPATAARPTT